MKIAAVISTNGGIISNLLNLDYFKDKLVYMVSDRKCGAIDLANKYSIKHDIFYAQNGKEFSDKISENIDWAEFDLIISFYTKLFYGQFISMNKGKLINIHPSILPACRGMNGFENTIKSGSTFIGSTVHFVDEGIDTGKPIIQSARPYNPHLTFSTNRHLVFIDQCIILLQAIRWFEEGRIANNKERIIIRDAKYEISAYAPNVDFNEVNKLV